MKRLKGLAATDSDLEARAAALKACEKDPAFFINEFVWTEDPRLIALGLPSAIPFVLFAFQAVFIKWLHDRLQKREGGVVEKSRDMGFTWLAAAFAVWLWLFHDGAVVCFGSRKVELVDKKGDPKSIFHKVRFIIDRLPAWMKPKGYDRRKHDNHLRIINPENGAAITGEGGEQIGRGGRSLFYFADEWAFTPGADEKDGALSNNTEIVVYGSSSNGIGNNFYRKRSGGEYSVFRMHWKHDPRKTPEWREAFLKKYGPIITAQEVDINYTASVEGILIPAKWVEAATDFDIVAHAKAIGLAYTPPEDPVGGLDIADGGADSTVLIPRRGPVVGWPIERTEGNTTKTGRWAVHQAEQLGILELYYDSVGVGAGVGGHLEDQPRQFVHEGVNAGDAPTETVWDNGKLSTELFANLKAELHWLLRERFERTWEVVQGITPMGYGEGEHQPEDLISLQDHPKLIPEISTPKFSTNEKGRIRIETKKQLKDRLGAGASPDFLEALVLAFAGDVVGSPILIGRA